MRKEIRDLFFKTLASEKESFNKRYEKTDNCLACVRLSAHISENLHSKLDSIARDLYGASRLGFITVEEVEKIISACNNVISYTIREEFNQRIEDRFGEHEFFICYRRVHYNDTVERAEWWWNYINEEDV